MLFLIKITFKTLSFNTKLHSGTTFKISLRFHISDCLVASSTWVLYQSDTIIGERLEGNLILTYMRNEKKGIFTPCSEIYSSFVSTFKKLKMMNYYICSTFGSFSFLIWFILTLRKHLVCINDLEFHMLVLSLFDVPLYLKFTLETNSSQAHRCLISKWM